MDILKGHLVDAQIVQKPVFVSLKLWPFGSGFKLISLSMGNVKNCDFEYDLISKKFQLFADAR